MNNKQYKHEALISLKTLCDALEGRKPTKKDINKCNYTPHSNFYKREYGGIINALSIIYPDKYERYVVYNKEFLINEFNKVRQKLGYVPTFSKMREHACVHPCIYQSKYGSWNNFLRSINITRNEILTRPGYKKRHTSKKCLIAKDGHKCYSKGELEIDNFFFDNGIKHIKEVSYPFHDKFNKNCRKTADWKIGSIYVEYLGMLSHYSKPIRERYMDGEQEKSAFLLEQGLDFMFISPDNIATNGKEILDFLGGK